MNFGQALEVLKQGGRVSRVGWNGKGMWLQLQVPTPDSKMSLPYIYMHTSDKNLVPWLASQTDMLAEDWETIPVPNGEKMWDVILESGLTFKQADKIARSSRYTAITRPCWNGFHYYGIFNKRFVLFGDGLIKEVPKCRAYDTDKNDWCVVGRNSKATILVGEHIRDYPL